jgi:hypothetical protein
MSQTLRSGEVVMPAQTVLRSGEVIGTRPYRMRNNAETIV